MTQALLSRPQDSLAGVLKSPSTMSRVKEILGEKPAQRFIASLMSIGRDLGDVEPRSVLACGIKAATLALPIDKGLGFAWIVPYRENGKKVAQFQVGYKGYIQLAMRSGQMAAMNDFVIYDGELVEADRITGEVKIVPDARKSDKVVAYGFYFALVNGFRKTVIWTREEVVAHRNKHVPQWQKSKVWREHFDAMAAKTVIRNTLSKWAAMSVDVQEALRADGASYIDVDAEPEYLDQHIEEPADDGDDTDLAPTSTEAKA